MLQDSSIASTFYGAHIEQENDSLYLLMTNKFYDKEIARQVLSEIRETTTFKDASIVWYYLGRRRDDLSAGK